MTCEAIQVIPQDSAYQLQDYEEPNLKKLLVVSPRKEDRASLRRILSGSDWEIHETPNCRTGFSELHKARIPVVICERRLPDGDWKTILLEAAMLPLPPRVIVCSRLADSWLWAEVLNLGGFDVLATPFEEEEVVRVTSYALHSWDESRSSPQGTNGHWAAASVAGHLTH